MLTPVIYIPLLRQAYVSTELGWRKFLLQAALCLFVGVGCEDDSQLSAREAAKHAEFLAGLTLKDVSEVRAGLPKAAPLLTALWADGEPPSRDPEEVRTALERARRKVQDLRIAKSTFFALAEPSGLIVRNDQPQDLMAGEDLFASFPNAKLALNGKPVETRGAMHEARGVEGKPDAQWLAVQPISKNGKVLGLYVSGWSWALYARRLEEALKRELYGKPGKRPLTYVFLLVDGKAFGSPISPMVNAAAIEGLEGGHAKSMAAFKTTLTITGRGFGVAAHPAPALGDNVFVAVLRSET